MGGHAIRGAPALLVLGVLTAGTPSRAQGVETASRAAATEELIVLARWPDGLPAEDVTLELFGPNAAGGAERIDVAGSDSEGRLTFEILGGSGEVEIRAARLALPWRVRTPLPRTTPLEIVLPPPLEVVVTVSAPGSGTLDGVSFRGQSEIRDTRLGFTDESERALRRAAPGRFVWRGLHDAPVRIDFHPTWSRCAFRRADGVPADADNKATVVPPAELCLEAVPKRRLTGRLVTGDGTPAAGVRLRWEFEPSKDFDSRGEGPVAADGRFAVREPGTWTLARPPEGATARVRSADPRYSFEAERPWTGETDLDLGDIVVKPEPAPDAGMISLRVVDDLLRPVAGARILEGTQETARTDAEGKVSVPEAEGAGRFVFAGGHSPTSPDAIARGPERTVVLERTARVEILVGTESAPEPFLQPESMAVRPEDGNHRRRGPAGLAADTRAPGVWRFENLEPGMEFWIAWEGGLLERINGQSPLAPGEARRIVVPDPPSALDGRVVDEQGRPVPFALVTIFPDGTEVDALRRRTRADGTFRFPAARVAATALLHIGADGHAFGGRSGCEVTSAEPIRLETLRRVRVRALGPDGFPLRVFRAWADRPDYWTFQPKEFMCGFGIEERNRFPVAAVDGVATVAVLRGDRGLLVVEAGDLSAHRVVGPAEEEVLVPLVR